MVNFKGVSRLAPAPSHSPCTKRYGNPHSVGYLVLHADFFSCYFWKAGSCLRQLAQKHGRILLVERRFLLFQKKNKINPGCPHLPSPSHPRLWFIRTRKHRSLCCSKWTELFAGSFKYWVGGIWKGQEEDGNGWCPSKHDGQIPSIRNTLCHVYEVLGQSAIMIEENIYLGLVPNSWHRFPKTLIIS